MVVDRSQVLSAVNSSVEQRELDAVLAESDPRRVGFATPVIMAGVALERVERALGELIAEARRQSPTNGTSLVNFIGAATALITGVNRSTGIRSVGLKSAVVDTVGRTGGYINLEHALQGLSGIPIVGQEPAVMRYLIADARVDRRYDSAALTDAISRSAPVRHFTHVVQQGERVQTGAAYHIEYKSCLSRGKPRCDTPTACEYGQHPSACTKSTECALYTVCVQRQHHEGTLSCDERHALQGVPIGVLEARKADLRTVCAQGRQLIDELIPSDRTAYRPLITAVVHGFSEVAQTFDRYAQHLKPVVISRTVSLGG